MKAAMIDFLLARITEDEALAQAAGNRSAGPSWEVNGGRYVYGKCVAADAQWIEQARHMARHDPTRVLAECEAKRVIVEPFAKEWARPARLTDAYLSATLKLVLNAVIRPMATVYRDHPDFQREWAA